MAATDPTVQQDAGTPTQLPQGAATQLNAALPTETASPPVDVQGATPAPAPTPEMAQQSDYQPQFKAASEGDQFLTGPSLFPNQPLTAGAVQPAGEVMAPEEVARFYPAFVEAAQAPDAPPQLRALVKLLEYHLNK